MKVEINYQFMEDLIKKEIAKDNLSIQKLSDDLCISQRDLRNYIDGKRKMKLEFLIPLAKYLKLSLDNLFSYKITY